MSRAKRRVYIAGKLNGLACEYIQNVSRMIRAAELVRQAGFSVYIPCLDLLAGLVLGDWEYVDYFENSQPWLEQSEALLVVPQGAAESNGTQREIARAHARRIPIFQEPTVEESLVLMALHFE